MQKRDQRHSPSRWNLHRWFRSPLHESFIDASL